MDNWTCIGNIGRGGFGNVQLYQNKVTELKIAVKKTRRKRNNNDRDFEKRWTQEIGLLRKLNHRNIVPAYDGDLIGFDCRSDGVSTYPAIVMQYCSGGDVRKLLRQRKGLGLEESVICDILTDVIAGVEYLHALNVAHRDIKPENIVLESRNDRHGNDDDANSPAVVYKLIDFGLAKIFDSDGYAQSLVGTSAYLAPELHSRKEVKYTKFCDMWSLGIVIYELLNGRLPFTDIGIQRYLDLTETKGIISMRENEHNTVAIPSSTASTSTAPVSSWCREQYLNACRLLICRSGDERNRQSRNGRLQAYQFIDDVKNTKRIEVLVTSTTGQIQTINVLYKPGMHVIELLATASKRITNYKDSGSLPMENYIILRCNHRQLKLETNLRELFQNKVKLTIYAYLMPENIDASFELPRLISELLKGTQYKNQSELVYIFINFYNNIINGFLVSLKSIQIKCEFIQEIIDLMEMKRKTFALKLNNLNMKLELATQSYSMDLNQLELQRDSGFYSQKMTNSWRINIEHELIQSLNENSNSVMYQEPITTLAAIQNCLNISDQRVKDLDTNFRQSILSEFKGISSKSTKITEIINDLCKNLEGIFKQFYREIQAILRCTFALRSESEKLICTIDSDIKNTELLEKRLITKQLDRQRDIWKLIRLSGSNIIVQTKHNSEEKDINHISDLLDKEISDFTEIRKEINILFNDLKNK